MTNEELLKLDDAFKDCLLNGKELAKNYTDILLSAKRDDSLVFSLHTDWGNGKTFFVTRWHKFLKSVDYQTCYIDAFKYDWTDDPFILIVNSLSKELKLDTADPHIKKAMTSLAMAALKLIPTLGETISNSAEEAINAYEEFTQQLFKERIKRFQEYDSNIQNFKNIIKDKINDKPLVIFIDELDRCKPSFAVELLEQLKHIFDIPNVVFILMLNKVELANTIKGYYGGQIDGYKYLGKFIDASAELTFGNTNYTNYVKNIFNKTNYLTNIKEVESIIAHFDLSLRDMNQLEYFLSIVNFEARNYYFININTLLFFKCLYMKDNSTFAQFQQKDYHAFDIVIKHLIDITKLSNNINLANLIYWLAIIFNKKIDQSNRDEIESQYKIDSEILSRYANLSTKNNEIDRRYKAELLSLFQYVISSVNIIFGRYY